MTASNALSPENGNGTLINFEKNVEKHSKYTKEDALSEDRFLMSNEFDNNHYTPRVVPGNLINF
jgi:hypothetical protein